MGQVETIREISHLNVLDQFALASPPEYRIPAWLQAVLDLTPHGIMVLDQVGRELVCNAAFATAIESMLSMPSYLNRGAAILALPGFQKAFRDACSGFTSTIAISNASSHRMSFCFAQLSLSTNESMISITATRQLFGNNATLATFAQRHRLTQTECGVVRLLTQGDTPEVIAAKTSVMLSTVRSHIRSVLEKVDTDSIRALLVVLAELPIQNERRAQNQKTVQGGNALYGFGR